MKRPKRYLVPVAAMLFVSLLVGYVTAQAPPTSGVPTAGAIALLDVNHIFKHHHRFKMEMERMRADVEAAEAAVQKDREAIQRLAEQLERNNPNYKAIEQDIADRQARLAVSVRRQQRDFLEQEARIYHNTYIEIWQEVNHICRNQNIAMVLRFNRDVADTTKPEEVLRDIQKPVVWHRNGLDITDSVLAGLNRNPQRVGEQPMNPGSVRGPFQR